MLQRSRGLQKFSERYCELRRLWRGLRRWVHVPTGEMRVRRRRGLQCRQYGHLRRGTSVQHQSLRPQSLQLRRIGVRARSALFPGRPLRLIERGGPSEIGMS